ncbi:hypothetical protein ACFQ93_30280 [Streptomyces sp. NPDC056601]|uniref:hypothetical protein n=1 Tax=Streptomyces sp. NPDC056601 TaxID=3345875 RepID=UPI0036878FDC
MNDRPVPNAYEGLIAVNDRLLAHADGHGDGSPRLSGSEAAVIIVFAVLAVVLVETGHTVLETVMLLGAAGLSGLALSRLAGSRPLSRLAALLTRPY